MPSKPNKPSFRQPKTPEEFIAEASPSKGQPSGHKRLNINLPHDLWRELKIEAAKEERSVTDVVTELVRGYLVRRK